MPGLVKKYQLKKADGSDVDPEGVYMVFKANSDNINHKRAAIAACREYAREIRPVNPDFATDIEFMVAMCETTCGAKASEIFPRIETVNKIRNKGDNEQ